MRDIRTAAQEAAEDIFFGQVVTIWARWFVILAGAVLVLFTLDTSTGLSLAFIPLVVLIAANFVLHGRHYLERPVRAPLIFATSVLDIVIVTLLVVFWQGAQGLASPFYVLYYPVLLAFAFVMPWRATAVFGVLALSAYLGAVFAGDLLSGGLKGLFISNPELIEQLVLRLITLSATAGLGAYYWRIQRERRRSAQAGPAGGGSSRAAPPRAATVEA